MKVAFPTQENIGFDSIVYSHFGSARFFIIIDEKTGDLTARGNKIIKGTPMERYCVPEELTGTLLYLVSDLSMFVTGVVIPVDGGFSAYSGV